ncbi:MAG: hypothetical protein BMS9Abin26_0054 [Gammaproteobacteria bacterium]|nr:MAG: hypothetical protein BMS9Abin26_0054 [Gammaproteobacteria bacterium]
MPSTRLIKIYAFSSLLVLVFTALVLAWAYRQIATDSLVNREIQANQTLTSMLANFVGVGFADYLQTSKLQSAEQLRQHQKFRSLQTGLDALTLGLDIPAVTIINAEGRIVYARDVLMIGQVATGAQGINRALDGKIITSMDMQDGSFAGGQYPQGHSISSSLPIRSSSGEMIGTISIIRNLHGLVKNVTSNSYVIFSVVAMVFAVLYVFLIAIVHGASRHVDQETAREHQKKDEEIRQLAFYDSLTGLPNQTKFRDVLDLCTKRAKRYESILGVMIIGIDKFKSINEKYGHEAGDEALIQIARRLSLTIREVDVACRFSGDEFIVVLEDLSAPAEARLISERVKECLSSPLEVAGHKIHVTTCAGIAIYPHDTQNTGRLVTNAMSAMDRAKQLGQNSFAYYTDEMNKRNNSRIEMESSLDRAIEKNEFIAYYQPKVSAIDQRIVGMEALIRWQHPEKGLVPPIEFIDLLEETGQIIEVGEWMIGEAVRQCKSWHDAGYPELRVSINLSPKQFHSVSLLPCVEKTLIENNIEAKYVELEITEGVLAEDPEKAVAMLNELKGLGTSLSVDDFGTGYSSLSYLTDFPIDYLKIDRSFIRDMMNNRRHASITTAIIAIAKTLRLGIIAEGVEDEDQFRYLASMGCDEIQGFYFSKPVTPVAFTELLKQMNPKQAGNASTA